MSDFPHFSRGCVQDLALTGDAQKVGFTSLFAALEVGSVLERQLKGDERRAVRLWLKTSGYDGARYIMTSVSFDRWDVPQILAEIVLRPWEWRVAEGLTSASDYREISDKPWIPWSMLTA